MRQLIASLASTVSVASLALLAVPVAAQTPEHPIVVACAAGVSPAVRTARLQLAIEPAGRDTAASRAMAQQLFAGWTPPADLGVPALAVWESTTRNYPFNPLFDELSIVRAADGRVVRVGHAEPARLRERSDVLVRAIDQRIASVVELAAEATPVDTVVVLFAARAERKADAVALGEIEVRHLLPGDAPQVLRSPTPVYPKSPLQDGIEGTAQVSYIVRADSTVTAAQVIAADHPAFGQAVLDVAPRLRVAPGTAGGCAVSSVARQRFVFRLGD